MTDYNVMAANDGTYVLRGPDGTVTTWDSDPDDRDVWLAIFDNEGVNSEAIRSALLLVTEGFRRTEEA